MFIDIVSFPIYNLSMNFGILKEPIDFDWDEYNQTKIRLKHGLTTEEVEQTFFNYSVVKLDLAHSVSEQRYQMLGMSNEDRILFIAFTVRGSKIRVISARSADKKERQIYEEA